VNLMNINILVVEDEITVNNSISEFIKELGKPFCLAGSAANGVQALEYFKKTSIHILLTDIRMPQMDGLELIENISVQWPDTKMIILSGYNDFKYAQTAIQYGAADYLLKPLKKDELVSRLVKAASSLYNDTSAYSSLMVNQEKWDMTMIRIESELFDQVELGNVQGAEQSITNLLAAFSTKAGDDHLRIIPFIIDSLLALNKRLSSMEDVHGFVNDQWIELKSVLTPHHSYQEIQSRVSQFVVCCAETVKNFRMMTSPDVLHRCQEILNEHFVRDITLYEMAHLTGVTASYLSRLFKKQLGVNYTEYLNQLRINKAKELLAVPHLKILEIAGMVGYNNANYFTRIFKRYAGLTPQEFRDQRVAIS
jgi:two-component system response regulator YesN